MGKRLKSIYEFFDNYTKEEIDDVIEKLSEEEKKLIESRYGKDLNNPVAGKLSKEETSTFYSSLVYKMKKLLSQSKKRSEFENTFFKDKEEVSNQEKMEQTALDEIKIEESKEKINNENDLQPKSDNDYIKLLELLKMPTFNQIRDNLNIKETVIISLKFGFINGKYHSTESIANFLNIEKAEIIEVTKKVLLLYKQDINEFIDNAIVNEEEQISKEKRNK